MPPIRGNDRMFTVHGMNNKTIKRYYSNRFCTCTFNSNLDSITGAHCKHTFNLSRPFLFFFCDIYSSSHSDEISKYVFGFRVINVCEVRCSSVGLKPSSLFLSLKIKFSDTASPAACFRV